MFLDDKVIIAGVCFSFRWCVTSGCSSSPSSEPTPQLPTRGTARCRDVGHPCGARSVVEARCGLARIAHRRQWRRDDSIRETRRTTLGLRCVTLEATHGTGSPCRRTHLAQEGQSPNASRWPQRHSHHLPPCRGMLCQEISCNAGRHRQRPWSENLRPHACHRLEDRVAGVTARRRPDGFHRASTIGSKRCDDGYTGSRNSANQWSKT